ASQWPGSWAPWTARGRPASPPAADVARASSATARIARRSSFPVPSIGIASTRTKSSRRGVNRVGTPAARGPFRAPPPPALPPPALAQGVPPREPLPLASVADGRHGEDLRLGPDRPVQCLLDAAVRDHLAADLREARQPPGDPEEPVLVHRPDVAGDVPAV